MDKINKVLRKTTSIIYDFLISDGSESVEIPTEESFVSKKTNTSEKMVKATCIKNIKVGGKLPTEVTVSAEDKELKINLSSSFFQFIFENELSKLTNVKYEISYLCRDDNELKAYYSAIKINAHKNGFDVTFVD